MSAGARVLSPYMAHVVPGIEDLGAAELTNLGARVRETLAGFDQRDSLLLFAAREPALPLGARLVEDVFAVVLDAPLSPGPSSARAFASRIDRALNAVSRRRILVRGLPATAIVMVRA
jgi:hypothetical protein